MVEASWIRKYHDGSRKNKKHVTLLVASETSTAPTSVYDVATTGLSRNITLSVSRSSLICDLDQWLWLPVGILFWIIACVIQGKNAVRSFFDIENRCNWAL